MLVDAARLVLADVDCETRDAVGDGEREAAMLADGDGDGEGVDDGKSDTVVDGVGDVQRRMSTIRMRWLSSSATKRRPADVPAVTPLA